MTLDPITFIVVTVIAGAVGLVLLYFVVKNAIKNALIEDRRFQAKVQRMKDEAQRPTPSRDGASR